MFSTFYCLCAPLHFTEVTDKESLGNKNCPWEKQRKAVQQGGHSDVTQSSVLRHLLRREC